MYDKNINYMMNTTKLFKENKGSGECEHTIPPAMADAHNTIVSYVHQRTMFGTAIFIDSGLDHSTFHQ